MTTLVLIFNAFTRQLDYGYLMDNKTRKPCAPFMTGVRAAEYLANNTQIKVEASYS